METVAIYCRKRKTNPHPHWQENMKAHSLFLTGNTSHPHFTAQPDKAVKESIAIYCPSQPPHAKGNIKEFSLYLTGNTSRLHYTEQTAKAVYRNSRHLLSNSEE
jgi:hypothetical protein